MVFEYIKNSKNQNFNSLLSGNMGGELAW